MKRLTIPAFLRQLEKLRGQFEVVTTYSGRQTIRHVDLRDSYGEPCCPASAIEPDPQCRDNFSAKDSLVGLGMDYEDASDIVHAADGQPGPIRDALLRAVGLEETRK